MIHAVALHLHCMTNRIYHHVAGEMRESHLSGQDLQSTMRLVKSWILQILNLWDSQVPPAMW